MNTLTLKSKAELDKIEFFKRRHENNLAHASPALLETIDARMPPGVAHTAMQSIDNLMVGLGPRLMLLMMADTLMGLQANSPHAQDEASQIELGCWNRALYMMANDSVLYVETAKQFELANVFQDQSEELPGESKPKLEN